MPEPALDQLVQTLIEGTKEGTVRWQEATGDGNSFVTRRRSGTITIQRRAGIAGALVGGIALTVLDSHGGAVTEIVSPTAASTVAGIHSRAANQLGELFDVISSKHTGDHRVLQNLIKEFEAPD